MFQVFQKKTVKQYFHRFQGGKLSIQDKNDTVVSEQFYPKVDVKRPLSVHRILNVVLLLLSFPQSRFFCVFSFEAVGPKTVG